MVKTKIENTYTKELGIKVLENEYFILSIDTLREYLKYFVDEFFF